MTVLSGVEEAAFDVAATGLYARLYLLLVETPPEPAAPAQALAA